jgi:hypothetical protein
VIKVTEINPWRLKCAFNTRLGKVPKTETLPKSERWHFQAYQFFFESLKFYFEDLPLNLDLIIGKSETEI